MADIKISALPTATTPLTGAELVPIVQSGVTKQTTTSDVLAAPVTSLTASSAVATDASKKLVSVTNTGAGNNVLATSPTLVTPILGTPQSVTLTNATGLPISTGVSGLGTGVATALAINVGTAGSPVVNGGALGTPSSGTITNLTGTANITATGGASGAIAATTLSASSTVSGTGFSTYLASPPAIGGTAPAAASFTSLNTGQLAGLRNRIINGDFRIHQRGVAASGGQYPADRTYVNYSGANCSAITTTGQVFGNYKSANAIVITGAAGNTGSGFVQIIESANCRDMAGQVVTLSYWIYQDTGTSFSANPVIYYTGTVDGGIASGITDARVAATASVSCASGAWTYCTFTTTLVAAATTGLVLSIGMPATVAGKTAKIANLQLEIGSVATPFEQRPYGMELVLCQRYYYRTTPGSANRFGAGFLSTTTASQIAVPFPVTLRTAPTTLEQSGTAGDYGVANLAAGTACTAVPTYVTSSNICGTITFTTGALTAGQGVLGYAVNGNSYLGWSAEL